MNALGILLTLLGGAWYAAGSSLQVGHQSVHATTSPFDDYAYYDADAELREYLIPYNPGCTVAYCLLKDGPTG